MEDEDGQKTKRISSLEPWRKVKEVTNSRTKGNPLQLIMDRKPEDGRTVHLKDGSVVILTDDYRNGWPLEDSEAIIVARRRSIFLSTYSFLAYSYSLKMPIPRLAPNPAAQAPVLHYPAYVPGSDAYSVASSSTLVGTASASSLTVTMPTPELAPLSQQPKKAPIYPTPIPDIPSKLPAGGNPSNPAELSGAVIAADPPTSIRSHATVEQVNEEEDNSDNEGADGGVALPSYRGGVVHSTGSIGVTQVAAKKKKKRGLWGFFTGW
ncbi:hypothetical protein CPB84DRAFT_1765246 [Gymnopilus junonius]|uniref:Uncharacterized protein n=1 Tax=Gymnopilus junonius TaxID=109634 RepID=A0A9P5NV36_GYMJU|nr:hypothetical protein CPB84DRAFT_1765246 [Gymnopilus junonius]